MRQCGILGARTGFSTGARSLTAPAAIIHLDRTSVPRSSQQFITVPTPETPACGRETTVQEDRASDVLMPFEI